MLEISVLNVVLGALVPLLVALGTKKESSSAVKAYSNATLSAVLGAIAAISVADSVSLEIVVSGMFTTFATSITSYYGLHKPSGATPKVQDKTARFGL